MASRGHLDRRRVRCGSLAERREEVGVLDPVVLLTPLLVLAALLLLGSPAATSYSRSIPGRTSP